MAKPSLMCKQRLCLVFIITSLLFSICDCQCTFPSDLTGDWFTSHEAKAAQTWTSTTVTPFTVSTQGYTFNNLIYECYINSGNYYVTRSTTTINIFTVEYYIYACWNFTQLSSDKYLYSHATPELLQAQNARIHILPTFTTVSDYTVICNQTEFETHDYSLLLRNETQSDQKISCPTPLLATGIYTVSDSSSSYCNGNSWLDGCTTSGTLTANYTLCSTNIFYSAGGEVYCMYSTEYSTTDTDTYYVTLWNTDAAPDESSTYYFTCAVVNLASDGTVYMSTYPGDCLANTNMNATYISEATGRTLVMTTNTTCVPTSSSGDDVGLIVGIVFACLFFIAVIIVLGCLYYHCVYLKKKARPGSKIVPDTLPNTAMSQADKNKRMMFTPAPPKSAGPAGRQTNYYDGERVGSEISLRPTVSQLANYRTPTPYISDSKVDEESGGNVYMKLDENTTSPDGVSETPKQDTPAKPNQRTPAPSAAAPPSTTTNVIPVTATGATAGVSATVAVVSEEKAKSDKKSPAKSKDKKSPEKGKDKKSPEKGTKSKRETVTSSQEESLSPTTTINVNPVPATAAAIGVSATAAVVAEEKSAKSDKQSPEKGKEANRGTVTSSPTVTTNVTPVTATATAIGVSATAAVDSEEKSAKSKKQSPEKGKKAKRGTVTSPHEESSSLPTTTNVTPVAATGAAAGVPATAAVISEEISAKSDKTSEKSKNAKHAAVTSTQKEKSDDKAKSSSGSDTAVSQGTPHLESDGSEVDGKKIGTISNVQRAEEKTSDVVENQPQDRGTKVSRLGDMALPPPLPPLESENSTNDVQKPGEFSDPAPDREIQRTLAQGRDTPSDSDLDRSFVQGKLFSTAGESEKEHGFGDETPNQMFPIAATVAKPEPSGRGRALKSGSGPEDESQPAKPELKDTHLQKNKTAESRNGSAKRPIRTSTPTAKSPARPRQLSASQRTLSGSLQEQRAKSAALQNLKSAQQGSRISREVDDELLPLDMIRRDDLRRIKSADIRRLAAERKKRVKLERQKTKLPRKEKKKAEHSVAWSEDEAVEPAGGKSVQKSPSEARVSSKK